MRTGYLENFSKEWIQHWNEGAPLVCLRHPILRAVPLLLLQSMMAGRAYCQDWTAESNQSLAQFGNSVAPAGDVNGDGYADVIVGAPAYDNGQFDEGRAFVFLGSASGLLASPAWTAESNQDTPPIGPSFASSVACAGDVNNDGYSDVLVGAPAYDNGQSNEGRVFLFYGSPSGLETTAGWTAESNQVDAEFGGSVRGAGDINGDGFADIIIGAGNYDNGQSNEGRAFVYLGSASGLSSVAAWRAESNQADAHFGGWSFGGSVGGAGDLDGNGFTEVVVGAPGYDNGETNEGRAYIYRGSSTGLGTVAAWVRESDQAFGQFGYVSGAGDVNADGYGDVIIGAEGYGANGGAFAYYGSASGIAAAADWLVLGGPGTVVFGARVADAGDVDNDGYDDVMVGDPVFGHGQGGEGGAFVYFGSSSGLAPGVGWTSESNQDMAHFGESVAGAGDVNGDGYGDIIVGSDDYDNGQGGEGRAFVYHGRPSIMPSIVSVSPDHGANSGAVGIVITGSRFTGAMEVLFGNNAASFTINSDTQITADLEPLDTVGFVDVSVTNSAGTGTLNGAFDYFEPPFDVGDPCGDQFLTWSGFPTLGESYTVTTQNLGANTQVLLYEVSDRPIMAGQQSGVGGAPSGKAYQLLCPTYVDRGNTIVLGNNPSHTFAIPNDLGLLGLRLRTQAVVQTPLTTNRTQGLYAPIGE